MARYTQPHFIVDSSATFLRSTAIDTSLYLKGTIHTDVLTNVTSITPAALVLEANSGSDIIVKSYELGTMAGETSTNYTPLNIFNASFGYLDASIKELDTLAQRHDGSINYLFANDTDVSGLISNLEASIGALDLLTQIHTTNIYDNSTSLYNVDLSINALDILTQTHTVTILDVSIRVDALESSVGALDILTQTHTSDIAQLDASIIRLDAYDAIQDASILLAVAGTTTAWNGLTLSPDNSIGLGGTLGEPTDIDSNGFPFSITGALSIYGDLTVDGSVTYINSLDLNVSDNIITLNSGETGSGVSAGFAGIKIDRGTADPYIFVFEESSETFRIGIEQEASLGGVTQAVATRQDNPITDGIAVWNNTASRFDTISSFTFESGVGLKIPAPTENNTLFKVPLLNGDNVVQYRTLGTMAFAASTNYALKSDFDIVDASLYTLTQRVDVIDGSVAANTQSIQDLSTGKLDAVASTTGVTAGYEVFSNETNNIAYLKQIKAGAGITLTSDSSVINIIANNAAIAVAKYIGTFDGTINSSIGILQSTHNLGVGPLNVTVYDGIDQVYVDVVNYANGDIVLEWSSNSLTASCKYIIMG